MQETKSNYSALTVLITVFFFWGFIAAGNSIFIPFCKTYFNLDQFQSLLIDFAFYFAYYIGALILFIIGTSKGVDPVGKWGYKNSIVFGLIFSAIGAGSMIVSVYFNTFSGMLFGLFVVALGFSLQQTAANPFMISLGDEKTGSNRISLGGGINSLGTTIAPLIVGLALFGSVSVSEEMKQALTLDKVVILYIFVGLLFLAVAALFHFSKKLPVMVISEPVEKANKSLSSLLIMTGLLFVCFAPVFNSYRSESALKIAKYENELKNVISITSNSSTAEVIKNEIQQLKQPLEQERMMWLFLSFIVVVSILLISYFRSKNKKEGWGAMQFPQLVLGMLAIFIYVGVEVTIGSNLSELLKQEEFGAYDTNEIAPFIALFWGSLMIGRWASSVHVFDLTKKTKQILTAVVPLIAFALVLGFTALAGFEIANLLLFVVCVLIQIIAFYISKNKPAQTLFLFSFLGVTSTLLGLFTTGQIAVFSFLSGGLFCSIMWPCIFSLSLAGLGKYKAQGSAFLVMMILGGAIIPPIQGKLMDIVGIQNSFFVATICFSYLLFFAFFVKKSLNKQGVSLD